MAPAPRRAERTMDARMLERMQRRMGLVPLCRYVGSLAMTRIENS